MLTFKLRNRLHTVDNIKGAIVEFFDTAGKSVARSTPTNAHGLVTMDLHAVPPGNYDCTITAADTWDDPVGPDLLSGSGSVPHRVYRPVTLTVKLVAGKVFGAVPTVPAHASISWSASSMFVNIQPVWMRSPAHKLRGPSVSMIVIHHTACNLSKAVNTFLSDKSPHYMIDTDGQIVKWVQDSLAAAHAGVSRWLGHADINSRSIGIEIINISGAYTEEQYNALLALLDRLTTAFPNINTFDIVGHSDVGTSSDGTVGRKSGDPGMKFEWTRLERRGWGMLISYGPPVPGFYGGFFTLVPTGFLRAGDDDSHHHVGGKVHKGFTGTPVRELQDDLAAIGYSLVPNGKFDKKTERAVIAFQEHFFAAGRGNGTANGHVDYNTASMIKGVRDASGR